jgi:hypothetical protein
MSASLAVLFVFVCDGIHITVGRTAGGFAVVGVSAIACVCGSVHPCWHAGILVIISSVSAIAYV